MKRQRGFTLLELMVAMAIFAMLAVAGWQVFDSVNRARERAQTHADNLAVLQYAYLQLQQDMAQVVPYQALSDPNVSVAVPTNNRTDSTSPAGKQTRETVPEPFMKVDSEHISFVRFADPDPRYQSSTSIQHIEYVFADGRLIRRQYTSLENGSNSVSLDSVLLEDISAGRWQAYLPELSPKFPSDDVNNSASINTALGQTATTASTNPDAVLLPKGVSINFTYQDMPITWQWALTPQPIPQSTPSLTNNPEGNGNDSNGSSNTDNGSIENGN
ncbi:type II secretion system minor pseudopilin GspJ [Psychrobacter sp. PP-21]|uniref:type II secretion system minor pseudopilin GspJ n=1 Tax=Psychrobacter sp. PP-21 TaxID=2957503 RepID=UPI0029A5FDDB|nr:type II secretion system minor pseudopilin GspJ [Psychrobacter sp. PP-21]MDX2372838.1 type II secretion system minor pseudopilin GspJ [Psychrobacter sp. PP-21]